MARPIALLITPLLALLLAVMPLHAADPEDEETDLEALAKAIRTGKVPVYGELDMDYRRGRFHTVHIDLLGLDCGTCHWGDRYRADYLLLRHDEQLRKRAKGQPTRQVCLACHQQGGIATTFYVVRPGEKTEPVIKE